MFILFCKPKESFFFSSSTGWIYNESFAVTSQAMRKGTSFVWHIICPESYRILACIFVEPLEYKYIKYRIIKSGDPAIPMNHCICSLCQEKIIFLPPIPEEKKKGKKTNKQKVYKIAGKKKAQSCKDNKLHNKNHLQQ